MSSSHIEYHTHELTRKLIYSDWKLFGIKAQYVKIALIALLFILASLLNYHLTDTVHSATFIYFFVAVVVATFIGGFRMGFLITILSILSVEVSYLSHVISVFNNSDMIMLTSSFFFQSLFLCFVIENFLRLLRRLRRQADLLSLSHEAIIVRDQKTNCIIFWNIGAERIYQFTKAEALGKNIYDLLQVKPPISFSFNEIEEELLKKGSWEGELIHKNRKNKNLIVSSRWILRESDDNRSRVIVEINNDLTTQKALERRKDEFLSIASHELKTPVTSIKAFTQILETRFNKLGDSTSALYLSKMNTQINRLTHLVNDLLDSTRIESGKLELNVELFRIDDLIDEVIETIQLTSKKHKITKVNDTREMVYADRDRTEQVLINLINNAVKYSPRSDTVNVHIYKEKGFIKVGVEDRGIGIPKDKIHNIFDRFYRVESKEGEFTGLGLGLYISAEIVRRQNGQMWVESEEKIGSTFYFTLPTERIKL